jgi:hypothetical protein
VKNKEEVQNKPVLGNDQLLLGQRGKVEARLKAIEDWINGFKKFDK